jgi:hypothetical protein
MTRASTIGLALAALTVPAVAVTFAAPPRAVPPGRGRPVSPGTSQVFELRTYHTNPGKLEDLLKRSKDHLIPTLRKHGVQVVGFWTPQDEDKGKADTMVYLLAFPSRKAAEESWTAFKADDGWKKAFEESHRNGVLVKKVESVYLDPTDFSPMK